MKKTFTLLVTLFMGITVLMGQTPHELEKVTEGEIDYWVIDTPEDFIWACDSSAMLMDADNDGTPDFDSLEVKLAANYRLGADIVFDLEPSVVDWNNDGVINAFDELGLIAFGGEGPAFTGHFDGMYFTIENVYKNCIASERQRVALFGSINGATIEKFYLKNFNFANNEDYGGAVAARANYGGYNLLSQIKVEGVYDHSVRAGTCHTAGIVGRSKNTDVVECVSIITIIADTASNNRMGGLVGTMGDSTYIRNSYSASTIAAQEKIGQVVGYYEGEAYSAIENCYAAGVVSGQLDPDSEIGSFAGNLKALVPTGCYWDVTVDEIGVGAGDDVTGVMPMTTMLFGTEGNFVDWDFTDIWEMGTVNDVARPVLKWEALIGSNAQISVKDFGSKPQIHVYPNPATTNLTIENAPVNAEYSLYNITGQIQESGIVISNRMTLNMEQYEQGIYLLKVGDTVSKVLVK